jgi:hypothetical protein
MRFHPVYQIDVCKFKTLTSCKVDGTAADLWTPFDEWVTAADEDEDGENN